MSCCSYVKGFDEINVMIINQQKCDQFSDDSV